MSFKKYRNSLIVIAALVVIAVIVTSCRGSQLIAMPIPYI